MKKPTTKKPAPKKPAAKKSAERKTAPKKAAAKKPAAKKAPKPVKCLSLGYRRVGGISLAPVDERDKWVHVPGSTRFSPARTGYAVKSNLTDQQRRDYQAAYQAANPQGPRPFYISAANIQGQDHFKELEEALMDQSRLQLRLDGGHAPSAPRDPAARRAYNAKVLADAREGDSYR